MAAQSIKRIAATAAGTGSATSEAAPILALVRRLTNILEQEAEQLERNELGNLSQFIDQKSRSLFDLSRALAMHPNTSGIEGLDDELIKLRRAFEGNRSMLGVHLAAVHEVTEVIAAAMRQAESDGTYSTRIACAPTGAESQA
jgi:hypothetical protein